jgi:hypothetical protein
VRIICLGFELADRRKHPDDVGVDGETPLTGPDGALAMELATHCGEGTGVATWIWLGVRDGIRNWLLTAA